MDACQFNLWTKAGVVFRLSSYSPDMLPVQALLMIGQLKRDFKITHKAEPGTHVCICIEQDRGEQSMHQYAW